MSHETAWGTDIHTNGNILINGQLVYYSGRPNLLALFLYFLLTIKAVHHKYTDEKYTDMVRSYTIFMQCHLLVKT